MIVAEVVRSGFVESVHHGAVVVLDRSGVVLAAAGDVVSPVLPRSSLKPLQTVGMLRAGLVPREADDLALFSGSHYGEPFHVRRVRDVLAAAGLDESALRCPPAAPKAPAELGPWHAAGGRAEPILHNCSGKHAGMLATCVAAGWPRETYRDPGHPLQAAIAAAVTELAGELIADTAVDGCGAPVFALSLTGLARAFLGLVTAVPGSPAGRVAEAMRSRPELVAGTGAEDTVLIGAVPGLIAKGGAEGVHAVAVPGVGAVALKIADGAMRARMPVLAAGLRRLGVTSPWPGEWVLGGGEPVGEVRSVW
ncbi:asparaginase [Mangrovihabitans endophyticus]|uniref:Asparaginase n=1 Tax=Mangrovihabitans endophyticus TaxID=1751298 RepID=A0A8J3BXV6_9ACTN|nr:asparaginase [Mangrovihabitans endophyticus]GGK82706.1 asparaginase [Mangrovihabitans endophyticus]